MLLSLRIRRFLVKRLRRLLGRSPYRIQAAALPYYQRNGGHEVMLITSRGTGRWVIPKGWPEPEEALWATAAREAVEEAGLSGEIAKKEFGRFHYIKHMPHGRERRCEVLVYPLEVQDVADEWREKNQRRRSWFTPQEAARLVNEPDLAELLERFGAQPPNQR